MSTDVVLLNNRTFFNENENIFIFERLYQEGDDELFTTFSITFGDGYNMHTLDLDFFYPKEVEQDIKCLDRFLVQIKKMIDTETPPKRFKQKYVQVVDSIDQRGLFARLEYGQHAWNKILDHSLVLCEFGSGDMIWYRQEYILQFYETMLKVMENVKKYFVKYKKLRTENRGNKIRMSE